MITGKLYDYLKWLSQVILPGLGTLYFTLAGIWGLPAAEQVVGTIVAIDLFLGLILGVSQVRYGKQIGGGVMHVDPTGEKLVYTLELDGDPEDLAGMQEVRFKVLTPT